MRPHLKNGCHTMNKCGALTTMRNDDSQQYMDAVSALYSPLHQARTREALQQSSERRKHTVLDMRRYMDRVKLSLPLDVSIIHITGTKGKGSTACFCESILRKRYKLNTGLFTSPHLVDIRERIRINGKPVSKNVFGQAYFDLRQRLEEEHGEQQQDDELLPQLPGYFRMLTLMAIYIFSHYHQPRIDVIVLEVGMGGRYDATNLFDMDRRDVVCGVTLLDLDHTRVLGNTLEQIAWEKGGIFCVNKQQGSSLLDHEVTRRPCGDISHTVIMEEFKPSKEEHPSRSSGTKRLFAIGTNPPSVLSVLRQCAFVEGMGQELHVVYEGQTVPLDCKLGLKGKHQRINAELAACLCEALVTNMTKRRPYYCDEGIMEDLLQEGLAHAFWPGRCQSVRIPVVELVSGSSRRRVVHIHLHCDGAHTVKSMEACLDWFQSVCDGKPHSQRALVFNCGHERNPVPLLKCLQSRVLFGTVYFCRSNSERPSMVSKSTARELIREYGLPIDNTGGHQDAATWQDTLADVWRYLETNTDDVTDATYVVSNVSVSQALDTIRRSALQSEGDVDVCVTGSLYIVGSALEAAGWTENEADGTLAVENP